MISFLVNNTSLNRENLDKKSKDKDQGKKTKVVEK